MNERKPGPWVTGLMRTMRQVWRDFGSSNIRDGFMHRAVIQPIDKAVLIVCKVIWSCSRAEDICWDYNLPKTVLMISTNPLHQITPDYTLLSNMTILHMGSVSAFLSHPSFLMCRVCTVIQCLLTISSVPFHPTPISRLWGELHKLQGSVLRYRCASWWSCTCVY